MPKNSLIRKLQLILNIYDATGWTANNDNTHIYLISQRQSGNEIWSANNIQPKK